MPQFRRADRAVFGEILPPFAVGTLAVLMILIGMELSDLLAQAVREKWAVLLVIRIVALNIPSVLVLTLPVSTALAASLATNRMARDNEVTVLRGAGVPLFRTFLPILVFGILLSGLDLWISDQVVPWTWREQQDVQNRLANSQAASPLDAGITIPIEHYIITFTSSQKIDQNRRKLNQLVIVDKGANGGPAASPSNAASAIAITTARSAEYENGMWRLQDVVIHHYNTEGFVTDEERRATDTWRQRIDFSQSYSSVAVQQADRLSFAELSDRAVAAARQGQIRAANEFEVARWFKLALPLMAMVFSLCAPPLTLRFARTGAFTGLLLSIVTVFVAWNTLLFMKAVGLGGYVSAPVAAWSTPILFTVLGLWLVRVQE